MGLPDYSLDIFNELGEELNKRGIELGQKDEIGLNYRIALTWMGLQNPERALEYYQKVLEGYQQRGWAQGTAAIFFKI